VTQHRTYAAEYTCTTKQGGEKSAQMEPPPRVLCFPPPFPSCTLLLAGGSCAFPLPCSHVSPRRCCLHQKLLEKENARLKQAEYIAGLSIHQSPHAKGKGGLGSTRELLVSFLATSLPTIAARVTSNPRPPSQQLASFFLVFLVV
jgi:hypothetical protein